MSPTGRTRKHFRERGIPTWITEHFDHILTRRKDLLGFIDLLALDPTHGIIGVQVTTGSNLAARKTKIVTERRRNALAWLLAGGRIELHGWRKVKLKRGGKAMRWALRSEPVTIHDFFTGGIWE